MPSELESTIRVEYTPEFKRNLRQLAKKYRHIKADIQPLLDSICQGQIPGDQIPGTIYEVYKARVQNSDSGKGKSGGYRIIYHRKDQESVVLITIYSKTEQADISSQEIRQILLNSENQSPKANDAGSDFTPTDSSDE